MNKSRIVSAACLMLVLSACGSEQKPADPPPAANTPYAAELDKARGVEQTLQQQKDSMDRTLQEKENPTAE